MLIVYNGAHYYFSCTVIRFGRVSTKFGTCTVVSVIEKVEEGKMCTFTLESTLFIFNKCPIYTHDGAVPNLPLTHTKRITFSN